MELISSSKDSYLCVLSFDIKKLSRLIIPKLLQLDYGDLKIFEA